MKWPMVLAALALVSALGARPADALHEVSSYSRTANTGGAGGNYFTGSPRYKGYDCSICHTNAAKQISVELTSEPPELVAAGQFTPNVGYTVTVKLVGEHRGLTSAFNPNTFTAEILGDDGAALGSLNPAGGSGLELVDDGRIIIAEGFGNGENQWSFFWFAPPEAAIGGRLYLALLDGDGADDPVRRFIDPINDDVATLELPVCPIGTTCTPTPEPPEETSPAGCSVSGSSPRPWTLLWLFALVVSTRRRYPR